MTVFTIICLFLTTLHCQLNSQSKIFLTQGQTWLMFPHRHFQAISTYTSNCTTIPNPKAIEYKQLATIASFPFNNSHTALDVHVEVDDSTSVFHYAKINIHGICSIYQVEQGSINLLYQFNVGQSFMNVILINKYNAVVWNCQEMIRLQYSLFTNKVITYSHKFETESARKCKLFQSNSIVCWSLTQIIVVILTDSQVITHIIPYSGEIIQTLLPLSNQKMDIFICSSMTCNISTIQTNWTMKVKLSYPFFIPVLGGDFHTESNTIMTVHPDSVILNDYIAGDDQQPQELHLKQQISFPVGLQCVYIENVRLLQEQIIVECFNFIGDEIDLVLLKDQQINYYFPYQPFIQSQAKSCRLQGKLNYLFLVCNDRLITKLNNFYFVQISNTTQQHLVEVQCIDQPQDATQQVQTYSFSVSLADYHEVYVNQLIDVDRIINYDTTLSIKLKYAFKLSDVNYYKIDSNCSFLGQIKYTPIDFLYYFSLYNRQKCVQIVSNGNRMFYRIIQINDTLFYVQQCYEIKSSYGCQLMDIEQNIRTLRMAVDGDTVVKLYIKDNYLVMQINELKQKIYDHQIVSYQLIGHTLQIRVNNTYYFNFIQNVIRHCGEWIQKKQEYRYYHQHHITLQVNQRSVREFIYNKVSVLQTKGLFEKQAIFDETVSYNFPFVGKRGYYMFIINQTHITKFYTQSPGLSIYSLPYNEQQNQVFSIKLIDIYIVIQYSIGFFQLYSTDEQAVSALLTTIQECILSDIILMDRNVLLIPIQSQMYMVRIQTDPLLAIGSLQPLYSRFYERCKVFITPVINNGTCPTLDTSVEPVSQNIELTFLFNIQQIDLDNSIQIQFQPYSCNGCSFQISQHKFRGPIFNYQLNDDYFGAFKLQTHLSVRSCQNIESQLNKMQQIRSSSDISNDFTMMINHSTIQLLDSQMKVKQSFIIFEPAYCPSYLMVGKYFIVLCQNYFILLTQNNSSAQIVNHQIVLNQSGRQNYDMQYEIISESNYIIYLLDPSYMMLIYLFDTNQLSLTAVQKHKFSKQVLDFGVIKDKLVVLQGESLCLSQSYLNEYKCYSLKDIIPSSYASTYSYQQLSIYQSSQTCIKTMLFSLNVLNLHIDLQINISALIPVFTIINAYAGFLYYELSQIISINLQNGQYLNFILLYQESENEAEGPMAVYYQFNQQYAINKAIGQIRSAEFIANYFHSNSTANFIVFKNIIFATANTDYDQKGRSCIAIQISDKLTVIQNYIDPPQLKFLVLRARNIHEIQSHYIKIKYEQEPGFIINNLIGLASVFVVFLLIVTGTRKCKNTKSQIQIHFIDSSIQESESDEHNSNSSNDNWNHSNDLSSLLHSKSNRSRSSSSHDFQLEQD